MHGITSDTCFTVCSGKLKFEILAGVKSPMLTFLQSFSQSKAP